MPFLLRCVGSIDTDTMIRFDWWWKNAWCKNRFKTWSLWEDPNITFEMELTCHEFCNSSRLLPVGSISKKIVSRKSHKIWKMTALPYISKYSYISRWLGSYIYYHLPPPWWIAKRNIKIMGGFGSYMLALACKKKFV